MKKKWLLVGGIAMVLIVSFVVYSSNNGNLELMTKAVRTFLFVGEENPEEESSIIRENLISDKEKADLYYNFTNEVNMYFKDSLLNVEYKNVKIQFEVGIITDNGNEFDWNQLTTLFPNAKKHVHIYDKSHSYKYSVNITNIPIQYQDKVKYIYLKRVYTEGLTWEDVRVDDDGIVIKEKFKFWFEDLLDSGFTVTLNKTHFLIGNITENIINNNLLLDPEVTIDGDLEDATAETGASPVGVFINNSDGYVVYCSATGTGDLVYRKTIDGGVTWGNQVTISTLGQFFNPSVWYDEWTPNSGGTVIHILSPESANDDNWHFTLETKNDSITDTAAIEAILGISITPSSDGATSITKSTTGKLYATGPSATYEAAKSVDNGTTWTSITPAWLFDDDSDYAQLFPLSDGDILMVYFDISGNVVVWAIYDDATNGWINNNSILYTPPDVEARAYSGGTIYDDNIYLTNPDNPAVAGTIINMMFNDTTRTWTGLTNITVDALVDMYQSTLAVNSDTGDLYLVYSNETVAGQMTIHLQNSTDGGITWNTPVVINTDNDDLKFVKTNMMSNTRLYAFWYNDDLNSIIGSTILNVTLPYFTDAVINDTDVFIGETVNHTIDIADAISYVFSWNGSNGCDGTWTNSSFVDVTESPYLASNSSDIDSGCAGKTIGWKFYANNSLGTTESSESVYEVNVFGLLNVTLVLPTNDTNVSQNHSFSINGTVQCVGGTGAKCGTVYATTRFNRSSGSPDFNINSSVEEGLALVGESGASCVNLTNLGDSRVSEAFPNNNYGISTFLSVESRTSSNIRTWIKFYVSNFSNIDIINATLYLYYYAAPQEDPVGRTYNLYNTSDTLLESDNPWWEGNRNGLVCELPDCITWNNQTTIITLQSSAIIPSSNGWIGWNVTDAINSLDDGTKNLSLTIRDSSEDSATRYLSSFYSKEDGTNLPYLEVCFEESVDTANPQTSPSTLELGEEWNVSWIVNATGLNLTHWLVDVLFNSSYADVLDNETGDPRVCIGGCPPPTGEPPTDTCTATEGQDWVVDCADYCEVTSTTQINNLNLYGTGKFFIYADLFLKNITFDKNCEIFGTYGSGNIYPESNG